MGVRTCPLGGQKALAPNLTGGSANECLGTCRESSGNRPFCSRGRDLKQSMVEEVPSEDVKPGLTPLLPPLGPLAENLL